MGLGTNTLGYNHPLVNEAVVQAVNDGNMSTLNCPEEVFLAEKLISIHPWADMVKFARTGGEANAMAIRIARAYSKKDNIAICGYHGWHDWYLATNLSDENNLDTHLLPGLATDGVPKYLKNTVFPFQYNDIESLENLIKKNDIGIIKMEVSRSTLPNKDFIFKIRELADKNSIVLIFDECTSGFRQTYGGLHKELNINPDIAIFGKALGNGYAITSVIGRREVMDVAQNTFISSTFWSEKIGYVAGLKTLEVMDDIKSWDTITNIGRNISKKWLDLSKKTGLNIDITGLPALTGFKMNSKNFNLYKTYITQEMLKKNILATNTIYICIEHKEDIVEEYFHYLEKIFITIKECEDGRDIQKLLEVPEAYVGFKRLN